MNPPPLEITSLTHAGAVRSHNEDSHSASAEHGYAILADGMGGYNAGEVASEMAASQLSAALVAGLAAGTAPDDLLRQQVERINGAIYEAAQGNAQYTGMGTTLVAALFHGQSVTVAHVGDSRLYRLRGPAFGAITRDHSLLQQQIDAGLLSPEEARQSQHKNLVTRALGVEAGVVVEVHQHDSEPGDIYLLCSDGLNDMVADADIEQALRTTARLDEAAARLIQAANDNGGRDNVTVILVRVLAPPRGLLQRMRGLLLRSGRKE